MSANLQHSNQIPAGIASGMEPFFFEGEKWLIYNREVKPLDQFPTKIQNTVVSFFESDTESLSILNGMGIKTFPAQFDRWYMCVVGGLDAIPDISDFGKLTPDVFANTCNETDCKMRGKLCGRAVGLNSVEVATIRSFAKGRTIKEVAREHFITEAAVKSRMDKIHVKLNTRNMAQTIAESSAMGVIQ